MRRKLDEIASLTKAHLAIVGQANGTIGFGLETETERMNRMERTARWGTSEAAST